MTEQSSIVSVLRHDGWTPERRTQFLDHLAHDGSVRAACRCVGMSREAAYRLRRREALFARGWDAALVQARAVSAEALASRALDGVEEGVWYRGEQVGTRRKYDSRLLLAHMARLDKLAETLDAEHDAGRFDEILAVIGGEPVPPDIECDEDGMPQDRDGHIALSIDDANDVFDQRWQAEDPPRDDDDAGDGVNDNGDEDEDDYTDSDDDGRHDPVAAQARADRQAARDRAYQKALLEDRRNVGLTSGMRWDSWRGQAHAAADRLLGWADRAAAATEKAEPCTLSELSTSAGDAPAEAGSDTAAEAEIDAAPAKPTWPDSYLDRGPMPEE